MVILGNESKCIPLITLWIFLILNAKSNTHIKNLQRLLIITIETRKIMEQLLDKLPRK